MLTGRLMNFKLLERKTEKHEMQMLICGGGLKADENWMSIETSWVCDVARGQRDIIWLTTLSTVLKCA